MTPKEIIQLRKQIAILEKSEDSKQLEIAASLQKLIDGRCLFCGNILTAADIADNWCLLWANEEEIFLEAHLQYGDCYWKDPEAIRIC